MPVYSKLISAVALASLVVSGSAQGGLRANGVKYGTDFVEPVKTGTGIKYATDFVKPVKTGTGIKYATDFVKPVNGKGGDGKAGSNNAGEVKGVDGWDGIQRGGEKGGKDSGTKAAVVPATGARLLRGKNGPPTAANGGLTAGTMGGSVR